MNLSNYFDISRFWLLLKMELFRSKNALCMTLVITFGLMFFLGLVVDIITQPKEVYKHDENYAAAMLIGGFILSSLAFSDLTSTLKRYHYLTLPASTFEKFLCMWLMTGLGWILLFTLSFTFYTFIANPVGQLLFRYVTFIPFEPLGKLSTNAMKYYFVLHGIFLVGAVHFKGYVFPKTLFTLVVFAVLSGIVAYFIMKSSFLLEHECTSAGDCEVLVEIEKHPAWRLITQLFWLVFAPLCWVITYLGLKEKES